MYTYVHTYIHIYPYTCRLCSIDSREDLDSMSSRNSDDDLFKDCNEDSVTAVHKNTSDSLRYL